MLNLGGIIAAQVDALSLSGEINLMPGKLHDAAELFSEVIHFSDQNGRNAAIGAVQPGKVYSGHEPLPTRPSSQNDPAIQTQSADIESSGL